MSLQEILVPNTYNLYANSITTNDVIVSSSFSATPTVAQPITSVPVLINFQGPIVNSPNYNPSISAYTCPIAGNYRFFGKVQISYVLSTTGGDVLTAINLSSSTSGKMIITNGRQDNVQAGEDGLVTLNIEWYGPQAAGSVITMNMDNLSSTAGTLTSVSIAGPQAGVPVCIFFGEQA